MAKRSAKIPRTRALTALDRAGVAYAVCPYDYVPRGGARASSAALGAPLHQVIKTLVFEDHAGTPFFICQHGDREVSAKALARALGHKSVQPCDPAVAERHTGYRVGGTSPFGARKALPLFVESTILDLDRIWINGGGRGLLVSLHPAVLTDVFKATPVQAARSV